MMRRASYFAGGPGGGSPATGKLAGCLAVMTCLGSLAACGGGGDDYTAPVAKGMSIAGLEEETLTGRARANTSRVPRLEYVTVRAPQHGQVLLNASTGEFEYVPVEDFFGMDQFAFKVSDGRSWSNEALISISIQNVNDPPKIQPLQALANSAEVRDIRISPNVSDADGDQIALSARIDDPSVASVWVEAETGTILIQPLMRGVSAVEIAASDGHAEVTERFDFEVRDVTKTRELLIPRPSTSTIEIRNSSALEVDFGLTYSGTPVFESVEGMLDFAASMPDEFAGEGLERKIWRFVRDFTYHNAPFNAKQWLYNPWVTINSLGWGFCGHVSAAFVEIARAAGYEARIWGLDGHVVAEIKVAGAWRMYDTDLAVYYRGRDGVVAGVEALAADGLLITDPITPIFSGSAYEFPYSDVVADIYASSHDNFVGDHLFLDPMPMPRSRFMLPPGASLVFPGRWTEPPTGYNGPVPRQITQFGQASLRIPAGWSGDLAMPLVLWDVQGAGTIVIDGVNYVAGSEQLRDRVRSTDAPIVTLKVIAGQEGMALIFFINAMKFGIGAEESIALHGINVWALEADVIEVPIETARGSVRMMKPLPTVLSY